MSINSLEERGELKIVSVEPQGNVLLIDITADGFEQAGSAAARKFAADRAAKEGFGGCGVAQYGSAWLVLKGNEDYTPSRQDLREGGHDNTPLPQDALRFRSQWKVTRGI